MNGTINIRFEVPMLGDDKNTADDKEALCGNFPDVDEMPREALAAELKLLRDEILNLRRIELVKTGFSRTLYHDLKSPINTVISLIDVVLEEVFGPLNEKQKDFLRKSEDGLFRIVSLVERCLDIAKIEGEMFNQKPDDLLIEEILEPLVESLRIKADEKKIALSLKIEKGIPSIFIDRRSASHIFQNIIGNAIKYTREGGEVIVSTSRVGDRLTISVADNGIGMDGKEIAKIFSPFYRCYGAEKMDSKGTGLGLSITKMILDACGGSIEVQSSPGVGSVFSVSFSLRP